MVLETREQLFITLKPQPKQNKQIFKSTIASTSRRYNIPAKATLYHLYHKIKGIKEAYYNKATNKLKINNSKMIIDYKTTLYRELILKKKRVQRISISRRHVLSLLYCTKA